MQKHLPDKILKDYYTSGGGKLQTKKSGGLQMQCRPPENV